MWSFEIGVFNYLGRFLSVNCQNLTAIKILSVKGAWQHGGQLAALKCCLFFLWAYFYRNFVGGTLSVPFVGAFALILGSLLLIWLNKIAYCFEPCSLWTNITQLHKTSFQMNHYSHSVTWLLLWEFLWAINKLFNLPHTLPNRKFSKLF